MSNTTTGSIRPAPPESSFATMLSQFLRYGMEGLLTVMIVLSPWAYGAVHPGFEFLVFAGVGLLTFLWALRMLVEGQLWWKKCPVSLCLAGLFLLGIVQITPLPPAVLQTVSPTTARLYGELLPEEPEQVTAGEPLAPATPPAGTTVSVHPHGTRLQLVRMLAVFLVFAVVRNNLASTASMQRLGAAALVNGAALAAFAVAQRFGAPPKTVYWMFPTAGDLFGPFICRNHYPYYINLSIGLGLGLLWSRSGESDRRAERSRSRGERSADDKFSFTESVSKILNDPVSLWICMALSLMLMSVAFSLSRGGMLALVAAMCVCVTLRLTSGRGGLAQAAVMGLSLALALGLALWVGLDQVEARLSTLVEGRALEAGRLPIWRQAATIVRDFPVLGTGLGTFRYIDPVYRVDDQFGQMMVDHVHNDHLELLSEGGVVGLTLGWLAIGLTFAYGGSALNRKRGATVNGLALGGLFGFTTLVLHSFGDFGSHVPAIALLGTVVAAQLCALGSGGADDLPPAADGPGDPSVLRLGWVAMGPLVGALVIGALGFVVFERGYKSYVIERYTRAARFLGKADPGGDRPLMYLEAAANLDPDDARLQLETAEVYWGLVNDQNRALSGKSGLPTAVALVTAVGNGSAFPMGLAPWFATTAALRDAPAEHQKRQQRWQALALTHYLRARNACPVIFAVYTRLGEGADRMAKGDTASAYRARAKQLAPCDSALWYQLGAQELVARQPAEAFTSWRRCLELSDRYLDSIMATSAEALTGEGLLQNVLPDKPEMILAVALRLGSNPETRDEQKPLLEKALELLNEKGTLTLREQYAKGRAYAELGKREEALAVYRRLLAQEPRRANWRHEYAQLLYDQGRLAEARSEISTVLGQQPGNGSAQHLLSLINKAQLMGKK